MENLLRVDRANRTYIFLGVIIAMISGLLSTEFVFPFLIVALGLALGLILVSALHVENPKFLINMFIVAFLTRIILAIFLFYAAYISNGLGELGDACYYSINGKTIVDLWSGGVRNFDKLSQEARRLSGSGTIGPYDFWTAIVFFFTGSNSISIIFINCLFGSLTIIFVYALTEKICDTKAAQRASLLTAFWPSLFFWSIQNYKEPISLFLITVLIWSITLFKSQFRFYLLFFVIISAIALKAIRNFLYYIFYIVLPISIVFSLFRTYKKKFLYPFLVVIIFILVASSLYDAKGAIGNVIRSNMGFVEAEFLSSEVSPLEYIYELKLAKAKGARSAVSILAGIKNPAVFFLVSGPFFLLVAFLGPFPWMLGSAMQIMAVPETMVFYFLIPSIFAGGRFIVTKRLKEGGILVAYIVLMYILLALTEGNIGTLFRHRAVVLPFVFILAGIGKHE